ncbi:hypothetical protein [Arcanobacterium buesumense]|uniref:Uncharacterized protein n=1 Tax=Arcanobacterium buesumense TaxID=2722751 RepID=A0A6H2ELS1_9ACTO|nr:hypothetical protein [Arcanobacterium buesumense]QJC22012.1 hypothetical protein HC352_05515 [Arcanobacterium buesumense]
MSAVRVESPVYPELLILSPRVEFVDGVAFVEVDLLERLRKFTGLGLVIPDADPVPEAEEAEPDPKKTSRRGRGKKVEKE